MKYVPHSYQEYAIDYIETHPVSTIFLDMGLGKTSITLTAIKNLLFDYFEVYKVLVIAPLRVARDTWIAEKEKWEHLENLICSVAVGTEKERLDALKRKADVYIINRENIPWLVEESGIEFDYDMVVIDELSSFKNHNTKRFKALMKVRPKIKRIVGLTGTPAPNSLMDLWAQFRLMDMGERLGRFITQYRNSYFTPDKRNGQIIYSYKPLPNAEKEIYERICFAYWKAGEYDKALEQAKKLPNLYKARENALVYFLTGEEKKKIAKEALTPLAWALAHHLTALYETENNIEYLNKASQIIDILFPECERDGFIKAIKKKLDQ